MRSRLAGSGGGSSKHQVAMVEPVAIRPLIVFFLRFNGLGGQSRITNLKSQTSYSRWPMVQAEPIGGGCIGGVKVRALPLFRPHDSTDVLVVKRVPPTNQTADHKSQIGKWEAISCQQSARGRSDEGRRARDLAVCGGAGPSNRVVAASAD